jgi:hypothetical protein
MCDYDTNCPEGLLSIGSPVFSSHNICGSGTIDYADGYACLAGYLDYPNQDLGRLGLFNEVLEGLGVDLTSVATGTTYLFRLNSGIKSTEEAYRLDCGCLLAGCDSTDTIEPTQQSTICSSSLFVNQDGELDWDTAHLSLNPVMLLNESIGVSSIQLDGAITSMLETL